MTEFKPFEVGDRFLREDDNNKYTYVIGGILDTDDQGTALYIGREIVRPKVQEKGSHNTDIFLNIKKTHQELVNEYTYGEK